MAKNTSQGASSRHGARKSPALAPSPPSASEDRLAMLEESLNDVRQSKGSMKRDGLDAGSSRYPGS